MYLPVAPDVPPCVLAPLHHLISLMQPPFIPAWQVFLHHEKKILEAFQQGLQALWEPSRFTYGVNDALGVTQQAAGATQQQGGGGSGHPHAAVF
jgi:hypothetical protein